MDHIEEITSWTSGEDNQYISLSVSKDSDEKFTHAIKNATKMYQNGAQKGVTRISTAIKSMAKDPESLMNITARTIHNDAKQVSEAIIGSCDEYYYNDTSFIGLPPSSELSDRLKQSGVREKLELRIGQHTFRFFQTFMIKAELNLLLAGTEIILTLIVILATFQAIFFGGLTGFVGFVGTLALLASLNLVQFWYGFSRYVTVEEKMSLGVFSGQAIDYRFEQIRDVCSFHSNGDYRRRNQVWSVIVTIPFTIWYHATTFVVFIGTWIAKMIANRELDYMPSFWGIILTNMACAGIWLFGGQLWTGLALFNLLIQQRLYSSLLCRRSFPDFLLSVVVGNLFFVENGVGATEEDLHDLVDGIRCDPLVSRSVWTPSGSKSYDPPSAESASRASSPQKAATTSLSEDLESGPARKSEEWNPDNLVEPVGTEDSDGASTEAMTECSNDVDENLELLKIVSLNADASCIASVVSQKKTRDVYFGVETHEGTQIWKETTKNARLIFGNDTYTVQAHNWIMEQLDGRKFYSLKDSSRWVMAGEDTIRSQTRKVFVEPLKSEKAITSTIIEEENSMEDDQTSLNESRDEKEEQEQYRNDGKTTKFNFVPWRLTPTKKNSKKQTGRWKSWIHPKRRFAKKEEEDPQDPECFIKQSSSSIIVFGENDNVGLINFQEALKQAAEKHYPAEYNDTIHRQVIATFDEEIFHIPLSDGSYRPASEDETRINAIKIYDFHRNRLQLVDYLLKEIDIEMAELQDNTPEASPGSQNLIQYQQSKGQSSEGPFSEEYDDEDRDDDDDDNTDDSCKSEDSFVVNRAEDQICNRIIMVVSEEDQDFRALSARSSGNQTKSLNLRRSDEETSRTTISSNLSESGDRSAAEEEPELHEANSCRNLEEIPSPKTGNAGKILKVITKTKPPFSRIMRRLRKHTSKEPELETISKAENEANSTGHIEVLSPKDFVEESTQQNIPPKKQRSRFVVGLWRKVLERKQEKVDQQQKNENQLSNTVTLERERTAGTEAYIEPSGITPQHSNECGDEEAQDDNTIGSGVIPAAMGDRIELLPRRMFQPPDGQEANIYEHILSVLSEEFLNDDEFMEQSGGSVETGSTASSTVKSTDSDSAGPGSVDGNRSNSDSSSGTSPPHQSPPGIYLEEGKTDAKSLFGYIAYKLRQEKMDRDIATEEAVKISNETKILTPELENVETTGGETSISVKRSGDIKSCTVQDTLKEQIDLGCLQATNYGFGRSANDFGNLPKSEGMIHEKVVRQIEKNTLEGDVGASKGKSESIPDQTIEAKATDAEAPISPGKSSTSPSTDGDESRENDAEWNENYDETENTPTFVNQSVEVVMHEISTSPSPFSPTAMYTVVREPWKLEEKVPEQKPKKKMMIPKTLSSSSRGVKALFFSEEEERRDPASEELGPIISDEEGEATLDHSPKTKMLAALNAKLPREEENGGEASRISNPDRGIEAKPSLHSRRERAHSFLSDDEEAQAAKMNSLKTISPQNNSREQGGCFSVDAATRPVTSQMSGLDQEGHQAKPYSQPKIPWKSISLSSFISASASENEAVTTERTPPIDSSNEMDQEAELICEPNEASASEIASSSSRRGTVLSDEESPDCAEGLSVSEIHSSNPGRKMIAPKTLVMKDMITNKHDYMRADMLQKLHPGVLPSSEPNAAAQAKPVTSPTEEGKPLLEDTLGSVTTNPNSKKMMMPKTLVLSFSKEEDKKQMDDSEKVKNWISESQSKGHRSSSRLFSSLWKRALKKKSRRRKELQKGIEHRQDDGIESPAVKVTEPSQHSNSTTRIRIVSGGDDPPGSVGVDDPSAGESRNDDDISVLDGERDDSISERVGTSSIVPDASTWESNPVVSTRRRTIPLECDDNDDDDEKAGGEAAEEAEEEHDEKEMMDRMISILEEDYIVESRSRTGSTETKIQDEGKPSGPIEEPSVTPPESNATGKVNTGALYRYILYKLQQENAACGCFEGAANESDKGSMITAQNSPKSQSE